MRRSLSRSTNNPMRLRTHTVQLCFAWDPTHLTRSHPTSRSFSHKYRPRRKELLGYLNRADQQMPLMIMWSHHHFSKLDHIKRWCVRWEQPWITVAWAATYRWSKYYRVSPWVTMCWKLLWRTYCNVMTREDFRKEAKPCLMRSIRLILGNRKILVGRAKYHLH